MGKILVIGGGAAGMMAAVFAARAGAEVTLLEKNEKLGKKVYITGKGRCNLTNDCDLDGFLAQVPRNPRFLYSALSFFSSQDMMALMEENGCPVTVQRGKRVFPASEKASDVTKALTGLLRKLNVRVRLNSAVHRLQTAEGRITGCNNEMVIPALNLRVPLQEGDNVVEFTAAEPGVIPYTCWMGMLRGSITVEE